MRINQRHFIAAALAASGLSGPSLAGEITITPRVWLYYDDFLVRNGPQGPIVPFGEDSPFPGAIAQISVTREPFKVPMWGGSVSYFLDSLDLSLTGTGMFGSGREFSNSTSMFFDEFETEVLLGGVPTTVPVTMLSSGSDFQEYDFDRADFEVTLQKPVGSNVGLLFGARYEVFRADTTGFGRSFTMEHYVIDEQLNDVISLEITGETDSVGILDYDAVSVRGGFSATSAPLQVPGRPSLYGNLQIFGGWRRQWDEAVLTQTSTQTQDFSNTIIEEVTVSDIDRQIDEYFVGPDISVGFLKPLGENVTLDVRYRTLGYFNLRTEDRTRVRLGDGPVGESISETDDDADTPRVTHGLNVGLSVRF
jgi:hypothetical protein